MIIMMKKLLPFMLFISVLALGTIATVVYPRRPAISASDQTPANHDVAVTTPESVVSPISPSKTNTIPSYNSSASSNSSLTLIAGDGDWRIKYRDTTYGPEFTCRGAEYL